MLCLFDQKHQHIAARPYLDGCIVRIDWIYVSWLSSIIQTERAYLVPVI